MKVLLDHCVDRRFGRLISGHQIVHAFAAGWDKLANGRLLAAAEQGLFEVILTVDKNMRFQQNFSNRNISLIAIEAPGIDLDSLRPFAPVVEARLSAGLVPGSVIVLTLADLDG